VLGGPALGDIRSRCLRLSDTSTPEACAVTNLLGYRLPTDHAKAKQEWSAIIDGTSQLWRGVSNPFKDTIRAFLNEFNYHIIKQAHKHFKFSNGSVGNFFFAGARTFFNSIEAALFLYAKVSGVTDIVLPAIQVDIESRVMLGAELEDGSVIHGQNAISHPTWNQVEHGDKGNPETPLPSPIKRIFYKSADSNHEVSRITLRGALTLDP